MIVDQTPLTGRDAYLRESGETNLALGAGATERTGRSPDLGEGSFLQVGGLDLHLEGTDLEALFPLPAGPGDPDKGALLELRVRKEIFPSLYADPYRVRVHTVAGMEDFRRGTGTQVEPMELDGTTVLCSVGTGQVRWTSAVYVLPEPAALGAAAWDIPGVRTVRRGAFEYSLVLEVWRGAAPLDGPAEKVVLAQRVGPDQDRKAEGLTLGNTGAPVTDVRAYRVTLTADVRHDAALQERYTSQPDAPSRGRPVLAAVHLLETVRSAFAFDSLHEMVGAAAATHLFDSAGTPLRRIRCRLPIVASLGRGEDVSLVVRSAQLTRVEARLSATRLVRPPVSEPE